MSFTRLDFVRCESGVLISLFSKGGFFENLSNSTGQVRVKRAVSKEQMEENKRLVLESYVFFLHNWHPLHVPHLQEVGWRRAWK